MDKQRLKDYLDARERVLGDWEGLKKQASLKKLKHDRRFCHLCCYAMFRAIQLAIDISNHLVAEFNWPRPSQKYRESFETMGREKFIDNQLSESLAKLSDFRNILIHEYVDLDLTKVLSNLQKGDLLLRKFELRVYKELRKDRKKRPRAMSAAEI